MWNLGENSCVTDTDIKKPEQCKVLSTDFAERFCVKVTFISILLTFLTVATAETSFGLCCGVITRSNSGICGAALVDVLYPKC